MNYKSIALFFGLIVLLAVGGCVTASVGLLVFHEPSAYRQISRMIGKNESKVIKILGQPQFSEQNIRIWKNPKEFEGATYLVAQLQPRTNEIDLIEVYFKGKSTKDMLPFANKIAHDEPTFYGLPLSSTGIVPKGRIAIWNASHWTAMLTDPESFNPLPNGVHPFNGDGGACLLLSRLPQMRDGIEKLQHKYTEITLPFIGDAFALGDVKYTLEKVEAKRRVVSNRDLDKAFDVKNMKIGETRTVSTQYVADTLVVKYRVKNEQAVPIDITPDVRLVDSLAKEKRPSSSQKIRLKAGESKVLEIEFPKVKTTLEDRWKIVFRRKGQEKSVELAFYNFLVGT